MEFVTIASLSPNNVFNTPIVQFVFSVKKNCHVSNDNWPSLVTLLKSPGLQITVGHRTMAGQNLPMSDEIATLVGHFVRPIFCCNIRLYHLQIKLDFLIC